MADVVVSKAELYRLIAMRDMDAYYVDTAIYALLRNGILEKYGMKYNSSRSGFDAYDMPDENILALVPTVVRSYAYNHHPGQVGVEENVEGDIIAPEFGNSRVADLSVVGPASILGKIALELARRLREEIRMDRVAERMVPWIPEGIPDDPPPED